MQEHRKHDLQGQLRELAGARQLAIATYCNDRANPEQRAAARRLIRDIRRARLQLHAELVAHIRAGGQLW